jgi:hypothetical protein
MREHNVKALTELLEKAAGAETGGYRYTTRSVGAGGGGGHILESPARLAEWLVQAGAVLVPAAVTEQEALDLLHKEPATLYARVRPDGEGPWFREGLRRIASDSPAGTLEEEEEPILCLKGTHQWETSA